MGVESGAKSESEAKSLGVGMPPLQHCHQILCRLNFCKTFLGRSKKPISEDNVQMLKLLVLAQGMYSVHAIASCVGAVSFFMFPVLHHFRFSLSFAIDFSTF